MEKKSKYNLGRILFSKKALSLLGLAALTLALTFYFRANKFESFVEAQKGSLLSFYTKSLQPLFLGKTVTNEDIFNFAFYHELPLDREKHQYLQLGKDTSGKEYVEFRDVSAVQKTNNLEAFSNHLNLNTSQRRQMDSILNSYSEKIKTQVLVNENNTVAINENLWDLNKALLADLFLFASKANKTKFRQMVPPVLEFTDNPELPKIVSNIKAAEGDRYVFVTSDSVFMDEYKFDAGQFKKEAKQMEHEARQESRDIKLQMKFEKDYARNLKKSSKKQSQKDFTFYMDSTRFRIRMPNQPPIAPAIPDIEHFARQIEMATGFLKNIKFKMRPPVVPGGGGKHNTPPDAPEPPEGDTDSQGYFELNIDIPNIDSMIELGLKQTEIKKLLGNRDSLSIYGQLDSLQRARLKEDLRKASKEIKKLRKEYRKNSKNENAK